MASAADKYPGAESAGAPDDTPRVTRALPAVIDSAPTPPAPVERLDAAPEDASERFAFALWAAGRKDEAVEFLERQIARHKTADADLPDMHLRDMHLRDIRSPDMRSPDMRLDLAPMHVIAVPRPPIPKRPIVLAAAAIAAAMFFVWPGAERMAALPDKLGMPQLAFWAEEPTPAEAGAAAGAAVESPAPADSTAPVSVVIAAKEELGEDLPGEALIEDGSPAEALNEELIGEAVVEDGLPGEAAPGAVVDTARDASAAPEPIVTGSTAAAASEPTAPEPEIDFAKAEFPIGAGDTAPVTLQTLATGVESAPRLPRPRPEPSPQLVAALNAPAHASPVAVVQQWRTVEPPVPPAAMEDDPLVVVDRPIAGEVPSAAPLVIAEPPMPAGPYAAAVAPRGLTILGRVTRPMYAMPRAATRFVTVRRARAAERAAIRRYGPQWSLQPVATWSPQPALPWNTAPPSERWRYPPPPPAYDELYAYPGEDSWYD